MTFTYDPTTDIGMVRLMTRQTTEAKMTHTDEDIQAYLTLEGGVKLAAAQVMDDIASDQTLLKKVYTSGDYQIDGAKMAADLRKRAQTLRDQVAAGDDTALDIAELDWEDPI